MKVLVGEHDTYEGIAARERAAHEAKRAGGALLLFSFVKQDTAAADTEETIGRRVEELRTTADAIRSEHGIDVEVHVPAGYETPEEAILDLAEQHGVDLIVIGMRKRSRVGKLVLGSTAQQILLGARCPVLAVKVKA